MHIRAALVRFKSRSSNQRNPKPEQGDAGCYIVASGFIVGTSLPRTMRGQFAAKPSNVGTVCQKNRRSRRKIQIRSN